MRLPPELGPAAVSIIVHGGAGDLAPGDAPELAKNGCLEAARAGHAILRRGGSALDAVVEAVRVMEDDPQFNAGLGSALTLDGNRLIQTTRSQTPTRGPRPPPGPS